MIRSFLNNPMHRFSIRTKLIVIVCIFIFYPLLFVGYLGYRNYEEIMKDKFIHYAHNNVKELSTLVGNEIESLNTFAMNILYDNKIYEKHAQLKKNTDFFLEYNIKEELEAYLQSILLSKSEINRISFKFSGRDQVYSAYRFTQTSNIIPMEEIYEKTAGQLLPIYYVEKENNRIKNIYFSRIVNDRNTHEEIGIIVFTIKQEALFGMIENLMQNPVHNVFVHNEDKDSLFVLNPNDTSNENITLNYIDASKQDGIYKLDNDYLIIDTIQPLNWKISAIVSSDLLLKEVRNLSKNILLICLATLPIFIILIEILYADIIKPMNLLIKKMDDIKNGEMGVTMEVNRKDELGYLFECFNTMSKEIKRLIDYVYKEEIALKNAELKTLQSQINPHFLYNTLETINWTAQLNGIEEISDMVTALSNIMEANLDRKNQRMIPLLEEIQYINNYEFLIQKRFGKKIQFEQSIEEDALSVLIPRFLLQPLIENAVYHGLEPKGTGTVSLKIHTDNGLLNITVMDDGIGIEENRLDELKKNLNDSTMYETHKESSARISIGIINVHRRIQLIYGKTYGLHIESEYGKGTTIKISLPMDYDAIEGENNVQSAAH